MIETSYNNETALLVKVIPSVAEEECFALHGGTAINLFYENLPRLSVDIDLTYIPIEDRQTTLINISEALTRIQSRLQGRLPSPKFQLRSDISKLIVTSADTSIKIEVNQTKRGVIHPSPVMPLCPKARELYSTYSEIKVVDKGLLYGGKICAALDRQHPRDLFDVMPLLQSGGITDKIKEGFLLCLLSSDRPTHEILFPTLQDQRSALENKFDGMTDQLFSYEDFQRTRLALISEIHSSLTEQDKTFLLDFEAGNPDWKLYEFSKFPGVLWKLLNIKKLREQNPAKFKKMVKELEDKLGASG